MTGLIYIQFARKFLFFFQVSLGFINIYIFYFYPFKGGEVEVSKEFEEKIITTVNVLQGNTN